MCIHGDKAQAERDWVLSGGRSHFLCMWMCERRPKLGMVVLYKINTLLTLHHSQIGLSLAIHVHLPLALSCLPLEFRGGKSPILIATDVASRGLGKKVEGTTSSNLSYTAPLPSNPTVCL